MPTIDNYRDRALEVYGEECRGCGSGDDILVHHRNGDRSDHRIENLIPLCERCHGKVHGRSKEYAELVRELGYRPRGDETTTIQVTESAANALFDRKQRGESYEDVIWRLIEEADSDNE
jgi:5-methylcytosine-specific restriction endonuclease McrA